MKKKKKIRTYPQTSAEYFQLQIVSQYFTSLQTGLRPNDNSLQNSGDCGAKYQLRLVRGKEGKRAQRRRGGEGGKLGT